MRTLLRTLHMKLDDREYGYKTGFDAVIKLIAELDSFSTFVSHRCDISNETTLALFDTTVHKTGRLISQESTRNRAAKVYVYSNCVWYLSGDGSRRADYKFMAAFKSRVTKEQ